MATPPLPAGYKLQSAAPPLPKGYSLQRSADVPPAALSGPVSGGNGVAVPPALQGPPARGLASSPGEVAQAVGTHALNAVRGPLNAVAAPPQGTAEKVAQAVGPGGLPLYRTLVEPSIAPARRAIQQAGQGRFADAARSAESAIPVVGPWADQVESDVAQHGVAAGLAGLATDVAVPQAVGRVAAAIPAAADSSAAALINRTVGARKADFARGANPGRGYLDAGLGPSGSMESIADKAADAQSEVGHALGNAYTQATASGKLIPAAAVRSAIHPIIDTARSKAAGPGVMADPAAYDELKSSFEPALQAADAKGGFTPSELWGIRKAMNESLNWGDQSKLNLTKTQQRVSGALGGVLEDAVPEVQELNQNYQDLSKLQGRARERSNTGSSPLAGIVGKAAMTGAGALAGAATHSPIISGAGALAGAALDSIPVKTALASGMSGAGNILRPVAPIAPVAAVGDILAGGALSGPTAVGTQGGSAGNGEINNPQDNDAPLGKRGGVGQKYKDSNAENEQGAQSSSSIAPEPTPDTHDFSVSGWLKGNPGGDPDEAREQAAGLGFNVTE